MNRCLILDTETDGTEESSVCIEVAAIVFDVKRAAPVRSFSSLIRAESNGAEGVNRIPAGLLTDAPSPEKVWPAIARMAGECDAILCYGADFDRRFVPPEVVRSAPFICAMDDLQWPRATKPRMSLVALALAHDLGVSHAHRAMVDCDLLARLLARAHEMGIDLEAFLARGMRPKAIFQALVPFERKDEAKIAGFGWNEDGSRRWLRKMAIEDVGELPFPVKEVA